MKVLLFLLVATLSGFIPAFGQVAALDSLKSSFSVTADYSFNKSYNGKQIRLNYINPGMSTFGISFGLINDVFITQSGRWGSHTEGSNLSGYSLTAYTSFSLLHELKGDAVTLELLLELERSSQQEISGSKEFLNHQAGIGFDISKKVLIESDDALFTHIVHQGGFIAYPFSETQLSDPENYIWIRGRSGNSILFTQQHIQAHYSPILQFQENSSQANWFLQPSVNYIFGDNILFYSVGIVTAF